MVDRSHQKPGVAPTKRRPQGEIFGSHRHAPACGHWQVSKLSGECSRAKRARRLGSHSKKYPIHRWPSAENHHLALPRITLQRGEDRVSRSSRVLASSPRFDQRTLQGCFCPALAVLYHQELNSSPPAKRARKHRGMTMQRGCNSKPSGFASDLRTASSSGRPQRGANK